MAERSKALVLGTSLLGGVGSNPTPINFKFFFAQEECFALHRPGQHSELAQRKRVGLITQRSQDRNLDSLTLSRLAQLVERKTLNLVVVGSSPTVGIFAPVAQLAARRSHNPKVASSILAGSKLFFPAESIFFFGKQY